MNETTKIFSRRLLPVTCAYKVIILFLLICSPATVMGQIADTGITITIPAGKLVDAIRAIEEQHKILFAYERTMMDHYEVSQKQFIRQKLSVILTALLQGTPFIFEERDLSIILKKGPHQEARPPGSVATAKRTISGYVEDAFSGERLISVLLSVRGTDAGTATNNYGFFSITLPDAEAHIRVSGIGYTAMDTLVLPGADLRSIFKLKPDTNKLAQVIVKGDREAAIQHTAQMSKVSLSMHEIQAAPKFLGESDLMKTLQLLPGVQQGSEGTSAILVRGGSPDQNLILLDGAPLYSPSHLLGIFSTFNTSALKNVDLYKGAFPARFGGRISSVLDIATKDGDLTKIHGDFSMGLLASQLTLEGPLFKKRTSFVLSGRRTYTDLIINPIVKNANLQIKKLALFFYDLNAKVQHRFSDNDCLFLSLYNGQDKFHLKNKENSNPAYSSMEDLQFSWMNVNGTLRWNHVFAKDLFANTTFMVSDYSFKMGSTYDDVANSIPSKQKTTVRSGIRDYGLKVDLDYRPQPDHNIHAGAGIISHTFTPGVATELLQNNQQVTSRSSNNTRITGNELNVYGEDNWNVSRRLKVNYGLHWSVFATEGTFYQYMQPRISARYLLPADWGLKVAYTRMVQYLHLLSGNSITLPTDLWVPVTKNILPQVSDQFSVGLARGILNQKVSVSVELYYKSMNNIIEYKEGESYMITADKNWDEKVVAGKGRSYGLEVMVQKKESRLTGWVAYSLSRTERQIPGINFDRVFPYKYDRRHDLKLVAIYKLIPGIELSSAWVFQSAAPFTIPAGQYEGVISYDEYGNPENVVPNITARNNMRLASYHRLDMSVSFIKKKKSGRVRTWNLSVYNVYNRRNPFMYYTQLDNNNTMQLTQLTLLPVMPSISYNLKF